MNIWAVANQKGGVGKTTTAITLAGHLAGKGYKTLLVDLDPHGSLTSYLGVDLETAVRSVYGLFQAATSGKSLDALAMIRETEFERLHLMAASPALATLDRQLGAREGMGLVLSQALIQVENDYQYVILDCPPMLGVLMVSALAACDRLIVPVQTEFLAIKGLERMMRTLEMIEKSKNMSLAYSILPTLFDRRTRASVQSLQALRSDYKEHIGHSVIPVDTQFRDASRIGTPLSLMKPDARGSRAYEKFLEKLMLEKPVIEQPYMDKVVGL